MRARYLALVVGVTMSCTAAASAQNAPEADGDPPQPTRVKHDVLDALEARARAARARATDAQPQGDADALSLRQRLQQARAARASGKATLEDLRALAIDTINRQDAALARVRDARGMVGRAQQLHDEIALRVDRGERRADEGLAASCDLLVTLAEELADVVMCATEVHSAVQEDVIAYQDVLIARAAENAQNVEAANMTLRESRERMVADYRARRDALEVENARLKRNTVALFLAYQMVLGRLDDAQLMRLGTFGAEKLLDELKELNRAMEKLVEDLKLED